MASRAHAVRSYSFGNDAPRVRRDVWYRREDPVVLPRSRGFGVDYRLIGAALAASALVTLATYATFYTSPSPLAETPTEALAREWAPDVEMARASNLVLLSGPAHATRSVGATEHESDEVFFDASSGTAGPLSSDDERAFPHETTPRTSLSEESAVTTKAPADPIAYPDPIRTPPDAIAPSTSSAETPAPVTEPDNPYR